MEAESKPGQDKPDIPVEGPAPDPNTELIQSLTPRLDPDDERDLRNLVLTEYHAALSDRSEWESRLVEWEDQYYNRVGDKTFPWPGASNFHVPLTMMGVETYKPRLVDSILGQQPPIIVVPTTAAGEDRRVTVETVLNWQVQSKLKLEPVITQSAHLFLQPGLAVAKTYWKVERTRRKMVREFPPGTAIEAIFEALFGADKPQDLKTTGDLKWRGEIRTSPQGGPPLEAIIEMRVLEDGIQVLVDREEVTEGPQVDLIDPTDLIAPARGGHEVKDLPWIKHRLWMTEDALRLKVLQGRFYEDSVQTLVTSGPVGDEETDSGGYKASQDQAEGLVSDGSSDARAGEWPILEDYRRYDIDDDGLEEEIIVWVSEDLPDKILGWDYLDNVYAHGRRPLRVSRFFPIPFRFYGLSFAEMVKGIQDEINAIHNQRVDSGTLANLPFGFKRASSTIPPIQQRIRPGEFLDVDNPQQDVMIPKFNFSPAFGSQEEATLHQYFERLTGLSDLSMGRMPNRVGATRTAKGTQTLLSEGGLRFKTAMQAFQQFWVGIFEDILALDQEYLPPRQEFRVTGRRPAVIRVKDRTEIRGAYDLRLAATSDTMNREQMRQDASIIIQALMNPAAVQVGLVGKKGIRRAYQDLLKAYGKDPDFYLEDDAPVRSPIEELMLFTTGQYIAPVMGENFQAHIMAHQEAMRDPLVPPEAKQLLRRHLQETHQLMQAAQMAQMLQGPSGRAPMGPQATNAATGAAPQGAGAGPGGPASPAGAGMPSPMAQMGPQRG